jgi:hypothetical protein
VTRYFGRQLLNKHAKNYQNVNQSGLKINKTSQENKMSKTFSITETKFFHCFSFSLVLFDCNCAKCKYGATMIGPGPGSLARNQHRVSGDQQDSLGFRRFSWTAWASSLQFGCTALQAWTCSNCSH